MNAPVTAAYRALALGRPVLLVDDLRDGPGAGSGVVVTAAALTDARSMAFVVRETSGVVCVAMTGERLDVLRIPPMGGDRVGDRAGGGAPAFAVSVDLRVGISTGISAADRARTARALADPTTAFSDLVRPGHVLPLRVRDGGVLERARPAEAAVQLCRDAGLSPVAVLAAAVDADGGLAGRRALTELAERHDMAVVAVSDVLAVRHRDHRPVRAGATAALPTAHGRFRAVGYGPTAAGAGREEHLALVRGEPASGTGPVLVRVHRECALGDLFGSLRCGCAARLAAALAAIDASGRGVLVYLRSRHAFVRPACGDNQVGCAAPDDRHDPVAADVLRDLALADAEIVLLDDDPAGPGRLADHGIAVAGRRPLLGSVEADVV